MLCDEATSALDSKTEREILAALQQLAAGRTSLFVAHRLSTAAQADKIVVLDQVRVALSTLRVACGKRYTSQLPGAPHHWVHTGCPQRHRPAGLCWLMSRSKRSRRGLDHGKCSAVYPAQGHMAFERA